MARSRFALSSSIARKDIRRIRYFTARVSARPADPRLPERQQAYLQALRTVPLLTRSGRMRT
jgi:hypothetical protein